MKIAKTNDHPQIYMFYKVLKKIRWQDSQEILVRNETFKRIEKNLLTCKYNHHPWRFIKAMSEMFDETIAKITKKKPRKTKDCRIANELRDYFNKKMDVVMKKQGFCCGHWYKEVARTVSCSGKTSCSVQTNTIYYRFDSFTFCTKCFSKFEGDLFSFDGQTFDKRLFLEYYFHEERDEKFTRCSICQRRFHEVCVLYTRVSNIVYTCKNCQTSQNVKPAPSIRASMLPTTPCDRYITDFLKKHGVNVIGELTIRMVSNAQKAHPVSEIFQSFHNDIDEYPFRNCSLFTFFDTGKNSDICFFSIFFQMYGSDCPEPNKNSSYISYMDSVNLLPSNDRTKIYRLIMLGLFGFLNTIGSTRIFLWSCPPKKRNDYIFYTKPSHMKIPDRQRLSSWYKEMLNMGLQLNAIAGFNGIHSYAEKNWTEVFQIPYFDESDLWAVRLTEIFKLVEKESSKSTKEILKVLKKLEHEKSPAKKQKLLETLKSLKGKSQEFDEYEKIWESIKYQMKSYNNDYFVIDLVSTTTTDQQPQLMEVNGLNSSWLNDRHLFLDFFWSNMLEFSCERNAQYSTFIMIYRILAENKVCIQCKSSLGEGIVGDLKCRGCELELATQPEDQECETIERNSSCDDPQQIDVAAKVEQDEDNDMNVMAQVAVNSNHSSAERMKNVKFQTKTKRCSMTTDSDSETSLKSNESFEIIELSTQSEDDHDCEANLERDSNYGQHRRRNVLANLELENDIDMNPVEINSNHSSADKMKDVIRNEQRVKLESEVEINTKDKQCLNSPDSGCGPSLESNKSFEIIIVEEDENEELLTECSESDHEVIELFDSSDEASICSQTSDLEIDIKSSFLALSPIEVICVDSEAESD